MSPKRSQTFASWFRSQNFRNFATHEFTQYFARAANETPDRNLWANIVPTLRVVDDLRDHFGKPCIITSSYRSPRYNAKVGGAPQSYHTRFNALDIKINGVSPRKVYDVLNNWRHHGRFAGGLGLYSTFVHIDTRGRNATW